MIATLERAAAKRAFDAELAAIASQYRQRLIDSTEANAWRAWARTEYRAELDRIAACKALDAGILPDDC
jgi:hypothetical protein